MLLKTVYVKTDKGRDELEGRLYDLPAKARRLLILVDGQKSGAELLVGSRATVELKPLLKLLLKQGFIAPRDGQAIDFTEISTLESAELPSPSEPEPEPTDDPLPEYMRRARYVKTAKGWQELEERSHGLRTKARRVLILVDPQKTGADLSEITGFGKKIKSLLKLLIDEGFITPYVIEPVIKVVNAPTPWAITAGLPAKPKRTDYPPEVIASAKKLMLDTTQTYLGLLGAEVRRRLEASNDSDSIMMCVAQWSLALQESKKGKSVAESHLQEVLHVLGSAAM